MGNKIKIKKGVIYIATGEKYIQEALNSATSLKKHMPDISITLFCDKKIDSELFDNIIEIKNPEYGFIDKIKYIGKSSYDYTLFLDTDTYICDDISELFDLLDKFDIAAAHDCQKSTFAKNDLPKSFAEFNTGVLLFKKSQKVKKFLIDWGKIHERKSLENKNDINPKGKDLADQHSFLEAVYNSSLRIATLTERYHLRCPCGFFWGKVKIIHRREPDLKLAEKILNSKKGWRGYFLTPTTVKIIEYSQNKKEFINNIDKLKDNLDRFIGRAGIYLKNKLPRVYSFFKKLKE